MSISNARLNQIIKDHELWLSSSGREGQRADFTGQDLKGVKFPFKNLKMAIFRDADLTGADLYGAILRTADFTGAILRYANLGIAKMEWVIIENADLREARLFQTTLNFASLKGSDLRGADFSGASLSYCDLRGITVESISVNKELWQNTRLDHCKISEKVLSQIVPNYCPEGTIIGYKKIRRIGALSKEDPDGIHLIAELEIPPDALRVNSTSRQCRCSKAKVLSITNLDGTPVKSGEGASWLFSTTYYRVGEWVEEKDFSDDRRKTCVKGIHFFLTREEAEKYQV
ncbi:pentapeptide repeat-containing protein [Candidatus Saccharibacteria bacterium]|nr:pentapeptide repeat-containing protein [Candidatus Saccharibacteria bacterium]